MKNPQKSVEKTLKFISQKGYQSKNNNFLKAVSEFLVNLFDVDYVLIDKYSLQTPSKVDSVVVFSKGGLMPNISYKLANTPCENVIGKDICSYPNNIQSLFPKDEMLVQMNIEGYIGIPLWSSLGEPIGLIALLNSTPINNTLLIETILQIVAIKAAQVLEKTLTNNTLEDSKNHFKSIIENAGDALYMANFEGEILEVNKIACTTLGYTEKELLNLNVTDLDADFTDLKKAKKFWNTLEVGKPYTIETKHKRKDGSLFPVEIRIGVATVDNKKVTLGFARDLTGKKQAELEIIEKEEKFSKVFYNHPTAMEIVNFSTGERIDANESYFQCFEYDKNEFFKGNVFTETLLLNHEHIEINNQKLLKDGFFNNSEFAIKSKTGKIKNFIASGTRLNIGDGNFAILTFLDVTNQKKSEETLKRNEEKFKKLANLTFEGILISHNGVTVDVNKSFLKMFGYKSEELLGENVKQILFAEKYHNLITTNRIRRLTTPYEIEGIRKDGSTFMVEIESRNINLGKGISHRVSSFRDLTERKRRESENIKFATILKQSANTIVITDILGNIEYTNPKFTEDTGYTAKEAIGLNPRILSSGKQSKEFYKHLWETIKSGKTWKGQFQNKAKNGTIFWEQSTITPITNNAGEIINYLAIKENITKRKESEEQLKIAFKTIKEKEDYLSTILKTTNEGFWTINNKGITLEVNPEMCKILGHSQTNIIGKSIFEFVDEKNAKIFKKQLKKRGENASSTYEIELLKSNAKNTPCLFKTSPIYNNKKEKIGSFAMVTDISELKKAYEISENQNQELRKLSFELSYKNTLLLESNTRFKNLFEQSPVSIWEQDFSEAIALLSTKKAETSNLESYLDQNPEFVATCISKIKILDINKTTLELLRVNNKEELLAQIKKTDSKKAINAVKNELLSFVSGKTEFKDETEFIRTDGEVISAIIKSTLINNEGKVIASIIDVSALKKAKEKAERSDERYSLAVAATNLGIWDWDLSKNTIYYSKLWKAQIGYQPNEIENSVSSWKDYLHPNEYTEKCLKLENYLKNPEGQYFSEFRFRHKNGSYIWIQSRAKVSKNSKGEVVRMYGSHKDITRSIKAQQELEFQHIELIKAKEKAEESDRLKTEFLNNMSHEIRTPMNGILGFSQMLNEPDLEVDKRKYFVNIIQNSGNQLLRIIDDILEISRLGTKQVVVINEEVCLNHLLLELFSIFDIKAKENKTPLYLKKELSDEESTILTDQSKLNKIISNLLENALKFTNEGSIEFGYNIKNKNKLVALEIYVKDTGIGINPKKHKLIFERFEQAEKELTKKIGGLGLGLSIAKENTELLGGKISVKSKMMEGATFYVTIPYNPVFTDFKIEDKQEKYTILIAEDEEINYLYIETILTDILKLDCKIIHAKNGLEVIDCYKKNEAIDIILMDLKMPVLNGFEATKEIRKFNSEIPIIAQTAYTSADDRKKATLAGCNEFIIKPIDKKTLSAVINSYLNVEPNTVNGS
tara:strand:- start:747 stop:5216 length:4470 start_codon:yes stop_codon:yes gene_type:complete